LRYTNIPSTLVSVVPDVGFDDNLDSEVTGAFGPNTSDSFLAMCGQQRCDLGAGYYPMGTIGERVWYDTNLNGLREGNEPGVAGIVALAMDMSGDVMASATTDAQGYYRLENLHKGHHYVEFILPPDYIPTLPNVGNDENMDSDIDSSNGSMTTATVMIMPGEHIQGIDLGLVSASLPLTWYDVQVVNRGSYNLLNWTTLSAVTLTIREIVDASVKIHPNPVSDQLYLSYETNVDLGELRLSIIDVAGKKVVNGLVIDNKLNPGYKEYVIDVSAYPEGTYLLKLSTDKSSIIRRMIIVD